MPEKGRMTRIVRAKYGDPEQALPRLLKQHGSPALVAKAISTETGEKISANAVRVFFTRRGWSLQRSTWCSPAPHLTSSIPTGVEEGQG